MGLTNSHDDSMARVTVVVVVAATTSWLAYLYNKHVKNMPPIKWKRIGEIVEINCFPVKSCGPVQPIEINCGVLGVEQGLLRDRAFMIVTSENQFVTARAQPRLVLIKPKISGCKLILTAPGVSNIEIDFDELNHGLSNKNSIWDQAVNTIDCGDDIAIWLSRYVMGKDVGLRLAYNSDYSPNRPLHKWNILHNIAAKDAGILQDASAYMLLNQGSLDELNKNLDEIVTPLQFRPNFVIKGPKAFEEYYWNWVKIGKNVLLKYLKPCDRCIFVNIDPKTGERNSKQEPLNFLRNNSSFVRGGQGVMGSLFGLRRSGRVHIGDAVYVEDKQC